ncbi:LPP20 family lipoprotein [Sulfurimonas sp. HSL-1716]|uniref:LPP20 family lipoprotein n=1 Tax=Hydrocurvibacter sulfurireducens TaxID=3131937 RepID=UPI0031F999B9
MIKNFKTIAMGVVVAATLVGCGQPKPAQDEGDFRCKQDGVLAPKWTCNPQSYEGAIVGLGSAQNSKAGMNFTRNNAMAAARNDLALQIETQVKAKVENFVRGTGVGDKEVVDSVSTQVSKQLTKTTLNGSKQLEFWQNPESKTVYVLVGVPNDVVNKEAKKEIVKSSHNNEDALWQQFQSKQALDSLEKEFPTDK